VAGSADLLRLAALPLPNSRMRSRVSLIDEVETPRASRMSGPIPIPADKSEVRRLWSSAQCSNFECGLAGSLILRTFRSSSSPPCEIIDYEVSVYAIYAASIN